MGEIADMMLDGTLCQSCGVYIGDESAGDFPQHCADCARDARKTRQDKGNRKPQYKGRHRNGHIENV